MSLPSIPFFPCCGLVALGLTIGFFTGSSWQKQGQENPETAPTKSATRVPQAASRSLSFSESASPIKVADTEATLSSGELEDTLNTLILESSSSEKRQAITSHLQAWAAKDSTAAFEWLSENDQTLGAAITHYYTSIMDMHIEQNPASAKGLISDMAAGGMKDSFASQLAARLATQNPVEALKWSHSLDSPSARQIALETSIQGYAATDPRAAFLYASTVDDPQVQQFLLSHVGTVMAGNDPRTLIARVNDFPESTYPQILPRAAWALAAESPEEASEWISSLPQTPTRDRAVREANARLIAADPVKAHTLASSVSNPAMRYGLVRDALLAWHRIDPVSAQESLANDPKFTDQQKDLLKTDLETRAPLADLVVPQ